MAESNNKVSLGCGTLILIALIVLIFGNANRNVDKKLDEQLESLRTDVGSLRSEITKQSDSLAEIRRSLDEMSKRQPRPRIVSPAVRPEAFPVPPILEAPIPEEDSGSALPEN